MSEVPKPHMEPTGSMLIEAWHQYPLLKERIRDLEEQLQTVEHDRDLALESAKSNHAEKQRLKEQLEAGRENVRLLRRDLKFAKRNREDALEQLEAAIEALAQIAYDGPNPGLKRTAELQWASDIARRALASNPASEPDMLEPSDYGEPRL